MTSASSPHSSATGVAMPRARRKLATVAVMLGLIVAAFEGTVVAGAMPSITRALGGMSLYAWSFTAFLVTSTLGVLVCGKLADSFGRRPVFIGGMLVFLLGSLLCGASPSVAALIAFRALQGLGAGAIQPIAMTITSDIYTLEERARVQSVFTTAWGGANVLGPLIGGWIVVHSSWRWVFLVNLPVGLLAIAMLLVSYRDPPRPEAEREPSGVGAAIGAGLVVALVLIALEPAGASDPALRIALAIAATVSLAAFGWQQSHSDRPLLPRDVIREPVVRAGLLGGACAGALLYACSAYVPLWITQRAEHGALFAGAALVPLLGGWALASTFGVRVLIRYGMRASVAGGFAVAVIGAIALLACTRSTSHYAVHGALAALAVLGMGIGPAASTSLIAPQTQVQWHRRAAVTSAVYASRTLGGSLAVAALGAAHAVGDAQRAFIGVVMVALFAFVATWFAAPSRSPGSALQRTAE